MNAHVIEVTPDKDGKVFITLYGTKYQIVVKEPKQKTAAKEPKPEKTEKTKKA